MHTTQLLRGLSLLHLTCPAPAQPTPAAGMPAPHPPRVKHFRPHRATTRSQQCPKSYNRPGCQLSLNCFTCISRSLLTRTLTDGDYHPHFTEKVTGAQRGWGGGCHRDHPTVQPQRQESNSGCLVSSWNSPKTPSDVSLLLASRVGHIHSTTTTVPPPGESKAG